MQELTDDQLDGLFRKSAEEFNTPFDPAAWEAMKDQLDERDRTAFWKKWLPWGVPLLLLLLTGGTWYAYKEVQPAVAHSTVQSVARDKAASVAKSEQPDDEATRSIGPEPARTTPITVSAPASNKRTPRADVAGSTAERSTPSLRFTKSVSDVRKKTERTATERSLTTYKAKTTLGAEKPASIVAAPSEHGTKLSYSAERLRNKADAISNTPASKFRGRHKRGVAVITATPDYATEVTGSFGQQSVKEQPELTPEASAIAPVYLPTIAELAIRSGQWSMTPGLVNRQVAQPEIVEAASVPKETPSRGLSVRLAVAPDLSAIGLRNFSRPGTNVGMLLEYHLSSRWSVQAGVIRSTKVYGATPDQYGIEMPGSYTKPDRIDGVCAILDIPVNVRFDLALPPRLDNRLPASRWFVSGGVTSYIMLQEDYTFKYPPHTYNQPTEMSTSTGGYGFSQMNLSVGYERALSRRLSWQVEPFLKAPLKGVGLYKVNLLSTGAFLSLRYKL